MAVDRVGLAYAALLCSGGLLGYVRAGSLASLAAGLLFGSLAALGAHMSARDPPRPWLSAGTSGAVAVVMGLRFLGSGKLMPAGLMTLLSCLMLLKVLSGTIKRPHRF